MSLASESPQINEMMHFLQDSTNFAIAFGVFILLFLCAVIGLYMACCICSMRGELDIVTDDETGKPINKIFFRNPFKKKEPILPVSVEQN